MVAAVINIPFMAAATPALDKVLIVLLDMFITGEVFELLIPVTLPPVDERLG